MNHVHEAGRLPEGPRARTLWRAGNARESTGEGAPWDNRTMARGRHRLLSPFASAALALLFALGAGAWLPAAASAAGSSPPTRPGPVIPAPPVLDDVMGRGEGALFPDLPIGLGALPGARETAAFAAGRVAVGVVFLESDGSTMTSSEDWAREDPDYPGRDRREMVLAAVQRALDWWNARSPDGSLELFLPAANAYGAPRTVKTGYEPIRRAISSGWGGRKGVLSDAAWRWQAMDALGFKHDKTDDEPMPETLYADRLRARNGADWAFVVYVVDSLRAADGMFRNGVVAYTADLFGPYCMLTYDNDGYHFANFDAVLAHEMGHVFGALDEYAPPSPAYPSRGKLRSGYLGVINGNAVVGGNGGAHACIMLGSNETLRAFRDGDLCRWTRGQTGLRDSDGDTRPDVVDTRPAFSTKLETTDEASGAVTLRGAVTERPRKRGRISMGVYFRRDLSIKVPRDARYRVDGGAWQPLTATDGGFDEPSEAWALTTQPLAAGHHVLDLQATTGETAGRTRHFWAGPTPVKLELATNAAFSKTRLTVKRGAKARLYARSTSAGLPVARLAPLKLVRLADRRVVARLTTGENGTWTGTVKPARSGAYELRFAGAGQFRPASPVRVRIVVK